MRKFVDVAMRVNKLVEKTVVVAARSSECVDVRVTVTVASEPANHQ